MTGQMWWSRLKDRALGETARRLLNHQFKSFGKMTTLRLDTANHTVAVSAELLGRSEGGAVSISITGLPAAIASMAAATAAPSFGRAAG